MPNRIIKESICTSDSIAQLSWFEECFFVRLIVTVDDFGRMDARPAILRGRLFPLSSVTDKQIADGLRKLSSAGIVDLYTVGGKPYLHLTAWSKHQTPRAKESKYPAPDDADEQMQADANICKQMQSDAPDIRYSNSINDIRYSDTGKDAHTRFTPPTVEEVKAYCEERKNGVDAQHWFDYYASNGWKVGKNAMKDWKAAVRTWEKNGFTKQKSSAQQHVAESFHAESDEEKMERLRKLTERMSGNEDHD